VDGHLRASDDDRDRAVASLADHLLAGRLSLEEFTDRIESAYGAKVGDELEALQRDLPSQPAPHGWPHKPTRLTAAFLGHVVRRGHLTLRRWTVVCSFLSGVDLDLRQVEIEGTTATVNVIALLGKVDVLVPATLSVDVGGISMVGHRRHWGPVPAKAEAASIRVRVIGLFGSIDVWSIPPTIQGSCSDAITALMGFQTSRPH
jgi:Domain of unknown function (DUF1707)